MMFATSKPLVVLGCTACSFLFSYWFLLFQRMWVVQSKARTQRFPTIWYDLSLDTSSLYIVHSSLTQTSIKIWHTAHLSPLHYSHECLRDHAEDSYTWFDPSSGISPIGFDDACAFGALKLCKTVLWFWISFHRGVQPPIVRKKGSRSRT